MTLHFWRTERMNWTRKQAHEALGISDNTYRRYENGETPVPMHIRLACRALLENLPPI